MITQPDKRAGRSLVLKKNFVKVCAGNLGIPVLQPEDIRSDDFLMAVKSANPDIILTFAYGKILPPSILESAKLAPINIHASLLPKYRGAAPIQAAILHGDTETGITIMKMLEKMDAGPILKAFKIKIDSHFTAGILHDVIADKAAVCVPDELAGINVSTVFIDQDEKSASFTKKISKDDGFLDFTSPAAEILRRFKAYTPWPGVWTNYKNKRLKLLDLNYSDEVLAPGEVSCRPDKILIGTSDGALELKEIQLEGKNSMHAKQFVVGSPDFCEASLPS